MADAPEPLYTLPIHPLHAMSEHQHGSLPVRQSSNESDDAVPIANPNNTSELLTERLQAWKHAVSYLEDYIGATEKVHKAHAKEYEKVLKTISNPLKEGNHFDQTLGGIAGMFENMRANTQGLANTHLETEKNIHGSVLPILERLHKEIKNKSKELSSGAAKGAKEVEKSRNTTQKHIELLGSQTAAYGSSAHAIHKAQDDPYLVHRGIYHRLHKQILEENTNRNDLLSVQTNFATFETHVVEVIQQAMATFNQFVGAQAQTDLNLYADMLQSAQRVPPDFEWQGFTQRNGHLLIDPSSQPRSIDAVTFPNQNHTATQPLIEGTLERKSRNKLSMGGYTTGYYVITPSKYLMEFKDNDNVRKDPSPELAIYLPDATIGGINGEKFNIKGKDQSGGMSAKLSGHPEIAFKAHNAADAEKWYTIIREMAGVKPESGHFSGGSGSEPTSPVSVMNNGGPVGGMRQGSMGAMSGAPSRNVSGSNQIVSPISTTGQEHGVTGEGLVSSPVATTGSGGKVGGAMSPKEMEAANRI